MHPADFNPGPEATAKVLHHLTDARLTFHDVASLFNTSVPALCLWLSNPEIAAKLADLNTAGAARTRTIATLNLSSAIPVLLRIIDDFAYDAAHRLDDPRDPMTPILQLRERESVRRAVHLLFRLSRTPDAPPRPSEPRPHIDDRARQPHPALQEPAAPALPSDTRFSAPALNREPPAFEHHQNPDNPAASAPIPVQGVRAPDAPTRNAATTPDAARSHHPSDTLGRADLSDLVLSEPITDRAVTDGADIDDFAGRTDHAGQPRATAATAHPKLPPAERTTDEPDHTPIALALTFEQAVTHLKARAAEMGQSSRHAPKPAHAAPP